MPNPARAGVPRFGLVDDTPIRARSRPAPGTLPREGFLVHRRQ
jgi:hypothetical protein